MRTGGVPERSNGAVLKTVRRASASWVRIPPPPLISARNPCIGRGCARRRRWAFLSVVVRISPRLHGLTGEQLANSPFVNSARRRRRERSAQRSTAPASSRATPRGPQRSEQPRRPGGRRAPATRTTRTQAASPFRRAPSPRGSGCARRPRRALSASSSASLRRAAPSTSKPSSRSCRPRYSRVLGGEFGYAGQPAAFAHKLRAVLDDD